MSAEDDGLKATLERIQRRMGSTSGPVPTHDRDLRDVPEKDEEKGKEKMAHVDHTVFLACMAELEKTAAKVVRETSLAMSRSGKKPISISKFIQKLDRKELGWKFAAASEEGDASQGWPPPKKDPPNASKATRPRAILSPGAVSFPMVVT